MRAQRIHVRWRKKANFTSTRRWVLVVLESMSVQVQRISIRAQASVDMDWTSCVRWHVDVMQQYWCAVPCSLPSTMCFACCWSALRGRLVGIFTILLATFVDSPKFWSRTCWYTYWAKGLNVYCRKCWRKQCLGRSRVVFPNRQAFVTRKCHFKNPVKFVTFCKSVFWRTPSCFPALSVPFSVVNYR